MLLCLAAPAAGQSSSFGAGREGASRQAVRTDSGADTLLFLMGRRADDSLCRWRVEEKGDSTATAGPCDTLPRHVVKPYVRPDFLTEGDSIGIVSISSRVDDYMVNRVVRAIDILRSWGLGVRQSPHLLDRDGGWFATQDTLRAHDLQQMIDNPHLKAILFVRGGYGAVRVVDLVDWRPLAEHPKWLVGFSDLTTVHAVMQRVGMESIHGAMPAGFDVRMPQRDTSALWLREALFGRTTRYDTAPHPLNRNGRTCGRLAGGNLSVLHALNGTPQDLRLDEPTVLLIEDVGESIHHIDRMMQTMMRSGKLDRIVGLIVGDFTNIRNEERWGTTVEELIAGYARQLKVPVLFGLPAGHGPLNAALYMGREVELRVTDEGGTLLFR